MLSFFKKLFGRSTHQKTSIPSARVTGATDPIPAEKVAGVRMASDVITIDGDVIGGSIKRTITINGDLSASDEAVAELLRRRVASIQDECAEQLKAWTCSKCGAPLPESRTARFTLTCASCGTVFRAPQASTDRSGGVHFNGGAITVSGEVVGGDKIVIVNHGIS
ncbi:MAG: hypothetical protein HY870_15985 [Chloroflexi bacterium]|nr:hypothetical protein [Chloroflexota bacterium]